MCKIFLENEIMKNTNLTDNAILAYVGLRIIANSKKKKDYVLYDYVVYCLCGQIKNDNIKKCVINGIEELATLKIIDVLAETKSGKEIDFSNICFSTKRTNTNNSDSDNQNNSDKDITDNDDKNFKHFIMLDRNEIFCILNSTEKFKIKILRYFICMISTLNHSKYSGDTINQFTNVGSQSIQHLAELSNISKNAVIHYNKFLEENQLIYICRSDKFVANENGIIEKNFTNCYGRPKDKYSINSFQWKIENRYNANTGIKLLSDNVNTKRSMKMKFHQLKTGKGLKYSLEELNVIKEYMDNANHNATVRKQEIVFSDDDIAIINNRITELQKSQKEGDG